MNTTVRKFAVGLASAALVASAAAPAFAAVSDGNRISGEDRYDTAIAEAGKFTTGDVTAVIANGEDAHLADAIVGGKLAGGPVLFVNDDKDVQAKVKAALAKFSSRLKGLVVLGGTASVSDDAVKAIAPSEALAKAAKRLAGEDRYETAAKIAEAVKAQSAPAPTANKDTVYLANGVTQVDALVAGQIKDSSQILLTDGSGTLPKATLDYLKNNHPAKIVALGGTKAVTSGELAAAQAATTTTEETKKEAIQAAAVKLATANQDVVGYVTVDQTASNGAASNASKYVELTDAIAAPTTPVLSPTFASDDVDADAAKELAKATFPKVAPNLIGTYATAIYKPQFTGVDIAGSAAKTASEGAWDPAEKDDEGNTTTMFGGATAVNKHYNDSTAGVYTKAVAQWGADSTDLNVSAVIDALLGTGGTDGSALKASTAYNVKLNSGAAAKAVWDGIKDIFPEEAPLKISDTISIDNTTAAADLDKVTGEQLLKALYPNINFDGSHQLTAPEVATAQTQIKAALKTYVQALKDKADAAKQDLTDKTKALQAAADAYKTAVDLQTGTVATTSRVEGDTRYDTALNIAKQSFATFTANGVKKVYVANGFALADAVVSGYVDNATPDISGPVVLVEKDKLGDSVEAFFKTVNSSNPALEDDDAIALGGKAVVDDSVIEAAQKALAD